MRGVDQRLQLLRPAVRRVGRVRQHAVVAPVALAGEVGERHQLDRGDAEVDQRLQLLRRAGVGALGREGADVQLVDHRLAPRPAGPGVVAPLVGLRVDHLARPVDVLGLEARGRVGNQQLAVDAVAVARAGAGLGLECARTSRRAWPPVGPCDFPDVRDRPSSRPAPRGESARRRPPCTSAPNGIECRLTVFSCAATSAPAFPRPSPCRPGRRRARARTPRPRAR